MAQSPADEGGILQRVGAVGVEIDKTRRGNCNAQSSRVDTDFLQKRSLPRSEPIGIAYIGSCCRIKQGCAVAHRSRERVLDHQPDLYVAIFRSARINSARGFHA